MTPVQLLERLDGFAHQYPQLVPERIRTWLCYRHTSLILGASQNADVDEWEDLQDCP